MALPTNDVPKYPLTLPSSKKKIKFRPFLVKERSILLLALQEGTTEGIVSAVDELFKVCTFGECSVKNMPLIDVEYLFLHIRNKSIGEELDVLHPCIKCETENEVRLNLEDMKTVGLGASNDIDLENGMFLKMKHPTLELAAILSDEPTEEEVMRVITSCMDTIIKGDAVYKAQEESEEERNKFISTLTQGQLNKVEDFFKSTPKVMVSGAYTCKQCGEANGIVLEGLENFFA